MKTRRVSFMFVLASYGVILLFQNQFSIQREVFFEKLLLATGNYTSLEDNKQLRRNKLLYLNQTTAESLQRAHREYVSSNPSSTFDILSISSKFNLKLPHTQHETFASHSSIRNFIIATEDDDLDPTCYKTKTMGDVKTITNVCHNRYNYWQKQNAYNRLTKYFGGAFASFNWIQEKKNSVGWLCAQKRFHYAFVKYMAMLEENKDLIPDYLIIMDDDTYINVHDLEQYLMNMDGISKNKTDGYVPSSVETPVIFAGCRVRAPSNEISFSFPFGGWGIYLSKGTLKKWLEPMDCDSKQSDHHELCRRYTTSFVNNATDTTNITIGEGKYFQNGMNLNQVFMRYIQEQEYYCLHGDWFYGYIANYLNMSRHVIPGTGQFPTVGYGGHRAKDFDDNHFDFNRLHTIMGSEQYVNPEGLCLYGNNGPDKYNEEGMEKEVHFYIPTNHAVLRTRHRKKWKRSQTCIHNTTICHYIKDPNDMKRLYTESESNRTNSFSFTVVKS